MRWSIPRQLALAAAVSLAALLLWGVGRFRDYVDNDPGLCAQCHRASSEFALWTKGSHRGVACQQCHHATTSQGLAMLRAFLAGSEPGGRRKHAEVKLGACAECHASHDPRWPEIAGSPGHRVHVAEQHIACVTCHAQAMHGFTPAVATCKGCHGEHAVRTVGMQQLHCFACHNFRTREATLRPSRSDCLRCHLEKGVHPARFSDAAPMQFDCPACHHPHAASLAREQLPCLGCHPGVKRAGLHAPRGHAGCLDCHRPHLWKSGNESCPRCHEAKHAEGRSCALCHGFHGAGEPRPPPAPARPPEAGPGAEAPAAPGEAP